MSEGLKRRVPPWLKRLATGAPRAIITRLVKTGGALQWTRESWSRTWRSHTNLDFPAFDLCAPPDDRWVSGRRYGDATQEVGQHYTGERGAVYFEWQRRSGTIGAALNAEKFSAFIQPDQTIVDFGCGAGYMLDALVAARKIGVEPNEHARSEASARGLEVVSSAADLDTAAADVIVSNHALEHATRPLDELVELRRALRPHGRFVLWVPIDDWRVQKRPLLHDTNHHLYTWTPLLLHNLLTEAGYAVQSVRVVTHAWPPKTPLLLRFLPRPVWDRLAWLSAVIRRSRQIEAVCGPG